MKYCFLVWSPDISGGTNVIFEHATRLLLSGIDITILTEERVDPKRLTWFPGAEKLNWLTYEEARNIEFDLVIATWWRTVFYLEKVQAKRYAYFVQSIESKFYSEEEKCIRNLVEQTYALQLDYITEATWIKEYLQDKYGVNAFLVKNGIRKEYFNRDLLPIKKRDDNKTRVLIEGPLNVSFKNTELALELVKKSKADEIWLMTSTAIGAMKGVDKLFSRVPISKVGSIYSSCDVLVKLSTVEGMFGPPLEAFHCGCTAVTYDVTGFDEYIKHDYNALVSFTRTDDEVLNFIDKLCLDKKAQRNLKSNALITADEWPDWDKSSSLFATVCRDILDEDRGLNYLSTFSSARLSWSSFEESERLKGIESSSRYLKARLKLLTYINNNFPSLFFKLRKIKWNIKAALNSRS
ncbi:hypothetical protein CW749_19685 [Vibrio sp. vnigr-6D03]|uniref:glycosyltransferase family 4 protein n=1 Tax=Vibrio sp. vnigr-6D03 TaxID=2058088 RepID=UPI000C327E3B|nr:glycosyltransferase family 4 protein [Vibrio sp. vnigr-6D03]PKF77761.1 hypothetical protein CW749_19685 [Vibrio sp. vnigr-6D03]